MAMVETGILLGIKKPGPAHSADPGGSFMLSSESVVHQLSLIVITSEAVMFGFVSTSPSGIGKHRSRVIR